MKNIEWVISNIVGNFLLDNINKIRGFKYLWWWTIIVVIVQDLVFPILQLFWLIMTHLGLVQNPIFIPSDKKKKKLDIRERGKKKKLNVFNSMRKLQEKLAPWQRLISKRSERRWKHGPPIRVSSHHLFKFGDLKILWEQYKEKFLLKKKKKLKMWNFDGQMMILRYAWNLISSVNMGICGVHN